MLPVDMLNGYLLKHNIILPISVSQLYKFFILHLIFLRFLFFPNLFKTSLILVLILIIPSFFQILYQLKAAFFFHDIVSVSKYTTPFFSFLFFSNVIINNEQEKSIVKIFDLVRVSYVVLILNIFIKYFGFGFPMYEHGDIGSKGFFYAGNEVSVLFLILASILAHGLWKKRNKIKYYLFLLLNLAVALTISSKTAIFGIVLVFFLIPLKRISFKSISKKRLKLLFFYGILFIIVSFLSWKVIINSAVFSRISFFWESLDFWTFILSGRNIFFADALETYIHKYNFIEKVLGVGQSTYEQLNNGKIVEIDIIDIFFTYGFPGAFLFVSSIIFFLVKLINLSKTNQYSHCNFVYMMTFILLFVSITAGHVFNSGLSAIFLGLLLSMIFLKKE